MTLKAFFSLPYETSVLPMVIDDPIRLKTQSIRFEKIYVYSDRFINAKVRIVNFNEPDSHVFFQYRIKQENVLIMKRYLCKHKIVDGRVLITNISNEFIMH